MRMRPPSKLFPLPVAPTRITALSAAPVHEVKNASIHIIPRRFTV
jgi:hypothetical protein